MLLVTWCWGVTSAMGRIDRQMMTADFDGSELAPGGMLRSVVESWPAYWALTLTTGAVGAWLFWWIGGWWYAVRVRWSGAAYVDPRKARTALVYASFVATAPTVAWMLVATALYANYGAFYVADEWVSVALLIFPLWSFWVSYTGARTVFDVSHTRARVWFLILPVICYLVAIGALGYAAAA